MTGPAKKPIDNGWDKDNFPNLPSTPSPSTPSRGASDCSGRPDVMPGMRDITCAALIETTFAERAALEADGADKHVWAQPMWLLARVLCEQRQFTAYEHINLVADRLCELPATAPPDRVWRQALAARHADDWDRCNDHHHVVLRGSAAGVEAAASASYPASNGLSDLGTMQGPAEGIRKVVTRATGLAWADELELPVEQLLEVTTRTRPGNVSRRYMPRTMLRYLRGETPHGGSGHPVRDELVFAYGVSFPVATNLCHIVLGTQAFDSPGGFGSSSAACVLMTGSPVNDRVAHRWGACLVRAVNGGPVAVSLTNAVRARRPAPPQRAAAYGRGSPRPWCRNLTEETWEPRPAPAGATDQNKRTTYAPARRPG